MTQPAEAVGGDDHVVATELTPEERLEAAFSNPDNHIEEEPAEVAEEEAQAESETDEEVADVEDIEEEELPPIDPPNSLTAEEKEQFKGLPREAQEFTARRIGELEKGFNTKAQEAAQAKQAAQLEAYKVAEQIKAQAAEQLQRYANMFDVKPPSAELFRLDPQAYAQQLENYQFNTAQREQAQRDAEQARAEQAQIQTARAEHEAVAFRQQLETELPEIFDPATGQKLAQELNATAELLGFDPNEISDVSAIKALKVTSEWKTKADRLDALMAKKMERVRAGKTPPPISKPGVAQGANVQRKQAYQADREAMKLGDKDATARVLDSFFTQPK